MDAEEWLKKIVKDTGEVSSVYGGFKIRVLKPNLFPWYKIIKQLFDIGQEIWLNEKEGKISITSEPKVQ
jgi:hypothetical protein